MLAASPKVLLTTVMLYAGVLELLVMVIWLFMVLPTVNVALEGVAVMVVCGGSTISMEAGAGKVLSP